MGKLKYRYTIHFENHSGVGMVEFDGETYYYDHSEGAWHFADEGGRELVAQGSDVAYFKVEPLTVQQISAATE